MPTIGKRLLEERKRLNYNQTSFGKLGGVSKTTQLNYEAGTVSPDANYLSGIAAAGADLVYILTGHRSGEPSVLAASLSGRQKEIVEAWAALDEEGRERLTAELDRVRREAELKRENAELKSIRSSQGGSTHHVQQNFHKDAKQVAGGDININMANAECGDKPRKGQRRGT